jgi:hypothetical protein
MRKCAGYNVNTDRQTQVHAISTHHVVHDKPLMTRGAVKVALAAALEAIQE